MPVGDPKAVDAYLAKVPEPHRSALKRLRAQVRAAAPKAEEGMGYGLPGFYLDGPLLYYGAAKAHCAVYGALPASLDGDLADYERSKGTLKFPADRPLPAALVRKIVKACVAKNRERARAKAERVAAKATAAGARAKPAAKKR